jgi:Metallo-beta-lactamase superfamily
MFDVGEIEVLRVEESLGHGFQPKVLLPDWNARDIEPQLPWLAPTYYDAAVDRIVSSIHSWVLRTRHHTILIDTCVGNHKERPGQPRFHMLNRPYMENFAKAGLKVEDIDFVLCTHLHVDHVGWNTRLEGGRWVPTFPNAKYVFSKTDRDYFDPARGEGGNRSTMPACSTTACCRSWRPSRTWWWMARTSWATGSAYRRRRAIRRATC